MSNKVVNHLELYRLPWTLPDNAISWLEPTSMCNLACDGCYRENQKNSHKVGTSAALDDMPVTSKVRRQAEVTG